jgi:[ribosomal protein S5]-alanine N-acetyltransferase
MAVNCVFCKIIRSEVAASFVYRDKDISAFLDIHPINPGHTLVIPNSHYELFEEIPSPVLAKMMATAQEIQNGFVKAGIKMEGSNVFLSSGNVAGQEVPHVHLHITPRFLSDGHRMGFSGAAPDQVSRTELDQISKRLSLALDDSDWTPPALEGSRILLRPIVESDAESIFEYCGDPEVSKFTTWETHQTTEDSMALIRHARANYKRKNCEPYGIALKTNPKKIIGTTGWFWNTKQHKSIEIAYALARPFWGKGLIVEAVRLVVNEALKENDIHRISSRCISENKASQRVMDKLGMRFEGTLRQSMLVKGRFVDITHFSMTKEEWENHHE